MKTLKRKILSAARRAHEFLSEVKKDWTDDDPLIIQPYLGFTNRQEIYLRGRVLEDENVLVGKSDSEIRNLLNSFKRIETDEVPGVKVTLSIGKNFLETYTDEEGYFVFEGELEKALPVIDQLWYSAKLTLPGLPNTKADDIHATAELCCPNEKAQYGILSDVDDTVLQTHVTSLFKLRMLYMTLFKNAHQRLPMEGVVELFQAFAKGRNTEVHNPIFYVSNSPSNIYDYLEDFMEIPKLPKGPILLRDYGWRMLHRTEDQGHKRASIERVLNLFPDLSFILLGDTASKDADVYLEMARAFPERIHSIYIRHTKDTSNAERVAALIQATTDIDIRLIKTSEEIEQFARAKGLIS